MSEAIKTPKTGSSAPSGRVHPLVRARIQRRLNRAAIAMSEALALAQENGWPEAEGFVSGEGIGVYVHVLPCDPQKWQYSQTTPAISATVPEWGAGGF